MGSPNERLFAAMGETSAATALAARMGAGILADRNDLWPETVRGLIVHSAEWTKAMLGHLPKAKAKQKKLTHWRTIVRRYGWGVPDLDRALRSMTNDATIVIEDQLSPYQLDGSTIKTKEMGLHRLPWPARELEGIGKSAPNTDVELRVTLSYFVEPNPGERGWTKRHQYASHGLRFALRHAGESLDTFRRRINKAARDEGEEVKSVGSDKGWVLGESLRDNGAIHCDIWRGPAASLVDRDAIAVYPVAGCWKEQQPAKWEDRVARYALVISLRVPSSIDVHTPIAAIASRITTPVAIPIQTRTRQ
jgi:Subtilase family